jgi:phosphoenolpyruvate synthase/pyruvate phosphate dikinase
MIKGKISSVSDQQRDILLLPKADIKYTHLVLNSRGVIAKTGGYLSHLGITCREIGIPFVVSDEEFREGEMVFLDGEERKVTKLKDSVELEN